MSLRVLDLFSGIGGFSLGLEAAGMETVAFCEVSPVCRHLLAHHWPKVPCYDDVQTLTAERLAADGIGVDVICGGFPCQDLSYAGLGAGLDGARSGLWRDYARLIRELRPIVVVVENVAALLGRGLGVVLGDLAASGYDAEWDCIPAFAVGAPHRRDRLWIVAYARGEQHKGFGDAFRRALAAQLFDANTHLAGLEVWLSGSSLEAPLPSTERPCADVADANGGVYPGRLDSGADCSPTSRGQGRDPSEGEASHGERLRAEPSASSEALANTAGERQPKARRVRSEQPAQRASSRRQALADAKGFGRNEGYQDTGGSGQRAGLAGEWPRPAYGSWWATEPNVGRVAHGVPARAHRLHGLGNAVVPQIPEAIGRAILEGLAA